MPPLKRLISRPLSLISPFRSASTLPQYQPFSVVPTCPSPTCSCGPAPPNLDINHALPLDGTMAQYAQQVLISTGQSDWSSRIEDDGINTAWGLLGRKLKSMMGRGGEFSDPYNNIMITNSSFALPRKSESTSAADDRIAHALLFPSFTSVQVSPENDDSVRDLIRSTLLPTQLHPMHDMLPPELRQKMTRQPERADYIVPGKLSDIRHPTILICGHGGRDERCGILGPILLEEFTKQLNKRGISTTLDGHFPDSNSPVIAAAGRRMAHSGGPVNLGLISHIGGHKFAGNIIIYIPRSESVRGRATNADHALAGRGVWYGRVAPQHVEGIIEETVLEGNVIGELFRGGVGQHGERLRL